MGAAYSKDQAPPSYRIVTEGTVRKGDRLWFHNQGWLVANPSIIGDPVSKYIVCRKIEASDEKTR